MLITWRCLLTEPQICPPHQLLSLPALEALPRVAIPLLHVATLLTGAPATQQGPLECQQRQRQVLQSAIRGALSKRTTASCPPLLIVALLVVALLPLLRRVLSLLWGVLAAAHDSDTDWTPTLLISEQRPHLVD